MNWTVAGVIPAGFVGFLLFQEEYNRSAVDMAPPSLSSTSPSTSNAESTDNDESTSGTTGVRGAPCAHGGMREEVRNETKRPSARGEEYDLMP